MNIINFSKFDSSVLEENKIRTIYGGAVNTCPNGYSFDTVTDVGCTEYYKSGYKNGSWEVWKDHEVCDTNKCQ